MDFFIPQEWKIALRTIFNPPCFSKNNRHPEIQSYIHKHLLRVTYAGGMVFGSWHVWNLHLKRKEKYVVQNRTSKRKDYKRLSNSSNFKLSALSINLQLTVLFGAHKQC